MQQSLRETSSNIRLDDLTIKKIQALIIEERNLDDKQLYEEDLLNEELSIDRGESL